MKKLITRGRRKQRGMALFVSLILIAVLTGATIALASLASSDVEIAASDRRGALAFTIAEAGVDEVLSDTRLADPAFSPDPSNPTLAIGYVPQTGSPPGCVAPNCEALYDATVKYVREGPVEESSALEVKSIVYSVSVNGTYFVPGTAEAMSRTPVNAEIYRIAPKTLGLVTRARHYE
jgi:Tfp pilus assembly protein PilX